MRITIEIDSPAAGNVHVVNSTPAAAPSEAAEMAVGNVSSQRLTATNAGPAPIRPETNGVSTATPGAPAVDPGEASDATTSAGAAPQ